MRQEVIGDVLVLNVVGRAGSAGGRQLADVLSTAIENGYRRILCDIEGLDYASSPGLLALDAAGERVRRSGGELLLCGLTGPVRIALELSGIEPHFDVAECRPSALARWAHGRSASSEE